MAAPSGLSKARFIQLDANFLKKNGGKDVAVQFNPETLKVSYANQLDQSSKSQEKPKEGAKDQSSKSGQQFVGAGTTKLSLQLWFDVNAPIVEGPNVTDVRDLTKEIAYFITPLHEGETFIPPAVQFVWGSFHFNGLMDSLEESLEFFSEDGVPLRASMSISMSQQKIEQFSGGGTTITLPGIKLTGTTPLTQVSTGTTLQGLADKLGKGNTWQAIAEANNIENPRILTPGTLINFNVK